MIAVDTNVLVYAPPEASPPHGAATAALKRLIEGPAAVGVPWPVVHEFLAVTTHPRIYRPPTSVPLALAAIDSLLQAPGVHLLGESSDHLSVLGSLLASGQVTGARIPDARVAAICLAHGVDALWSADRDFSWFPQLRVVNPLVDPHL